MLAAFIFEKSESTSVEHSYRGDESGRNRAVGGPNRQAR
jgi:hypothetical protein